MKTIPDLTKYPNIIKVVSVGSRGLRVLYRCEQCGQSFDVALSKIQYGQRYCSRKCSDEARKAGLPKRFWSKVDRSGGPDTCWPWLTSALADFGYGVVGVGGRRKNGGRTEKAHRVAWMLTFGPIADGLNVLHSCDNPLCCNPSHLFLGTLADNTADMVAKGRHAHGECSYAKLTWEQVEEIRKRYATGSESQRWIARDYGISRSMVGLIVRGERWAS